MILSGVTVGHGAIIGAGAVVASDVAPYAVVVGNPARVLRMRFDEATVDRLLVVQWWNWDDDTIRARAHLLTDVAALLQAAGQDLPAEPGSRTSPPDMQPAPRTPHDLYLELLRDVLLGLLVEQPRSTKHSTIAGDDVRPLKSVEQQRAGRDWPVEGLTMVGEARLEDVRACVERVIDDGVAGDIIEAGTWRRGAMIFARGVLAARAVRDRRVWVADSFSGLPPPQEEFPPTPATRCTTRTTCASPRRGRWSAPTSRATTCSTIRCGSCLVVCRHPAHPGRRAFRCRPARRRHVRLDDGLVRRALPRSLPSAGT